MRATTVANKKRPAGTRPDSIIRRKARDWSERQNEEQDGNFLSDWADLVAKFGSFHGVPWYSRMRYGWCKVSVFLFIMTVCFGLPVLCVNVFIHFLTKVDLTDSVSWSKAKSIRYPNITICHPNFFDKTRMAEQNISDDMANFLALTFDPAAPYFLQLYEETNHTMAATIHGLSKELDQILADRSMTMMELLHAISVRCEDTIIFCEVHRKQFFTGAGIPEETNCCKAFFRERPYFVTHGTCFVAKSSALEHYPFSWSTVEFWVRFDPSLSPGILIKYKGTDAVKRNGVFFAITSKDHPLFALNSNLYRAIPGSISTLALRIRQINREKLGGYFCLSEDAAADFSSTYRGLPYTRTNCEFLSAWESVGKKLGCSYRGFIELDPDPSRQLCSTGNLLGNPLVSFPDLHGIDSASAGDDEEVVEEVGSGEELGAQCKFECKRVDYKARLQYGGIDQKQLDEVHLDAATTSVIQLYFESFDFEKHTVTKETLLEFLSRVGGWISLAVGASTISFIELAYFLSLLMWEAAVRCFRSGGRSNSSKITVVS